MAGNVIRVLILLLCLLLTEGYNLQCHSRCFGVNSQSTKTTGVLKATNSGRRQTPPSFVQTSDVNSLPIYIFQL
ncbi:hypothetical protein QVD17_17355 [Tagetes erecta]|uniref:Uncharacterized protein n=1 Tax=Tagetes erecta TaxID=13708 RepID=A0AAD8NU97_TARER|nr:hypothetical protein QVD17_17355 [Tagetes erecta]